MRQQTNVSRVGQTHLSPALVYNVVVRVDINKRTNDVRQRRDAAIDEIQSTESRGRLVLRPMYTHKHTQHATCMRPRSFVQ